MVISKYAQDKVGDVAQFFIKGLQENTAPWVRPWSLSHDDIRPYNASSDREYTGINTLNLMLKGSQRGYKDNRWMTYKQLQAQGYTVSKETATPVMFWTLYGQSREKDENGNNKTGANGEAIYKRFRLRNPILKIYHVFNVEQVDNYNEPHPNPKLGFGFDLSNPNHLQYIEHFEQAGNRIQAFVDKLPIDVKTGAASMARASYGNGVIKMPPMASFDDPARYFATLLHETGHWAADMLKISSGDPFGSVGYAKEELRVEMASYLLGLDFKIGHDPSHHKSYVNSWIEQLEKDPHEILRASADATKIVLLLNELEHELSLATPDLDQIIESHGGYMNIDDPTTASMLNERIEQKYDALLKKNKDAALDKNRRFYLAVDFDRKEKFKDLVHQEDFTRNQWGYDRANKCWWVKKDSLDARSSAFDLFLPEQLDLIDHNINQYHSVEDFVLGTLREYDIVTKEPVNTSGGWVATGTADKPNGTHARYKVLAPKTADGNHGVMVKIWGVMETKTVFWKPNQTKAHSVSERQRVSYHAWKLNYNKELQGSQTVEATTVEQIHIFTKELISDFFENKAHPIKGDEVPYLVNKDISEVFLGEIKLDDDGKLVVPIKDWEGDITALQFIDENGKYFNKYGQVEGGFFVVNNNALDTDTVYIAEGLATGVTVRQALATDDSALVVCAMNLNNIAAVEAQFKEAGFHTVVMGDNDLQYVTAGEKDGLYNERRVMSATENLNKTLSTGDISIVPRFLSGDLNKGKTNLSDWNDYASKYGTDHLRGTVERALKRQSSLGYCDDNNTSLIRFNQSTTSSASAVGRMARDNKLDNSLEN